jgi:hypothetical protein
MRGGVRDHGLRRSVVIGSMVVALSAVVAPSAAHADSTGVASDPLIMGHGRAVVHRIVAIRAHGPRQMPKVGRVPFAGLGRGGGMTGPDESLGRVDR